MPGARYESESKQFNEKFGLNDFSVSDNYDTKKTLRNLNNILFNAGKKTSAVSLYVDNLVDALTVKMESITKIEAGKTYAAQEFSIGEFIVGYEKMMQAKYLDELEAGQNPSRKPFEGATFGQIAATAWSRVKHFEKPQEHILADSIRKGEISLDQLKAITGPAIERIMATKPDSFDIKWTLSDEGFTDFANLHLAMNAIQGIVSRRTLGQRINPFRWRRNRQESKYMRQLQEAHAEISNRTWDQRHAKLYAMEKQVLIGDAGKNLKAFSKAFTIDLLNEKIVEKATSAKQGKELFLNKDLSERIKKNISKILDVGKTEELKEGHKVVYGGLRDNTISFMQSAIREKIEEMWEKFDKANDPAEKEKVLAEGATTLFENVKTRLTFFRLQEKDKFVVAQKIADMCLNCYSPVASDEKYVQYGKNYYVSTKGAADIASSRDLKISPEEHLENLKQNEMLLLSEVRKELGIDKPVELPTIEEIKKLDDILREKMRQEEERQRQLAEERKQIEKETAEKKRIFLEKKAAAENNTKQTEAEDTKIQISIPGLSETANKTETAPKVEEIPTSVKTNVKE